MTDKPLWKHPVLVGVALFVLTLWTVVFFLPIIAFYSPWFRAKEDDVARMRNVLGQLGTAGDMFGSINALFSALALLGVAYAVILQREQVRLQREENTKSDIARHGSEIDGLTGSVLQSLGVMSGSISRLATTGQRDSIPSGKEERKAKVEEVLKGDDPQKLMNVILSLPPLEGMQAINEIMSSHIVMSLNRLKELAKPSKQAE
jgi:hypothetical protein